jgi:hypothetical protein
MEINNVLEIYYYQHLAETDPARLLALSADAQQRGYTLAPRTLAILRGAGHKHHMLPIVRLGATDLWDRALIVKRTERICDILWDRIYPWLT